MSSGRYDVSHSGQVADQVRAGVAAAVANGDGPLAAHSIQRAYVGLALLPFDLGESREYLAHAELHLRILFLSHWVINYAVHEKSRNVFVRRVRWRRRIVF